MKGIFTGTKMEQVRGKSVIYIFFRIPEEDTSGHVYTEPWFRNYKRVWAFYLPKAVKGDVVDGLVWKNRARRIINGDSQFKIVKKATLAPAPAADPTIGRLF